MTKRSGVVAVDLSSLDPKAARKQLESVIGARLRSWITTAEVSFTETARRLGMQRPELYDLMEGVRSFKLAWFPLLPAEVQRVALADLALAIGFELRPVADVPEGDCATEVIHELLDTIRAITATQADRRIDVREAHEELRELDELEELLAKRRAKLRAVIGEHAASVRGLS